MALRSTAAQVTQFSVDQVAVALSPGVEAGYPHVGHQVVDLLSAQGASLLAAITCTKNPIDQAWRAGEAVRKTIKKCIGIGAYVIPVVVFLNTAENVDIKGACAPIGKGQPFRTAP